MQLGKLLGLTLLFSLMFSGASWAQKITGTVLDEDGLGLPGASVSVEGTTNGVVTDATGNFTLNLMEAGDYVLVISFVGYEPYKDSIQLKADEIRKIEVSLEPNNTVLEEMVVVGYGVQRKREVTGSIAKIESPQIREIPAPSFDGALHGLASGVQVIQGSGLAGSPSMIRVRGIASISAAGDPLFVLDGIPITRDYFINESGGDRGGMNNNPLAAINPQDIESIEVLKDAAATAIYGSRGANGVIIITTKRGNKKGLNISYNNRLGVAWPTALPNMLKTPEYLQLYQEAYENDGGLGLAPLPNNISWERARETNTNWVDETIGMGLKNMHSASLMYGSKLVNIYANVTYDFNQSYLLGNSYERFSARLNHDWNLSKRLTVNFSNSISNGINDRVDAAWSGGLGAAMSNALPIYPIRWQEDIVDDEGNVIYREGDWTPMNMPNPVRDRELKSRITDEIRTINNVSLIYNMTDNIIVRASGSYEHMRIFDDIYEPAFVLSTTDHIGRAKRYPTWVDNWNSTLTANYIKTFKNKHDINFLFGSEYQRSLTQSYSNYEATDMPGSFREFELNDTSDNGSDTRFVEAADEKFSFLSYFSRLKYAYDRKYYVQATARVDGSSRFGRNYRYGFFPSISAGWVISEEGILNNNKHINFLKLRGSYGLTGNANIPNYARWGTYASSANSILYNGLPTMYPIRLENPDLRWETSQVLDGSIQIGLWKDRVTAEFAAYHKNTNDVLMNVTVQKNSGFQNYWANVGRIVNYGMELDFKSVNVDRPKITWTTKFNIAHNYNEIKSIGNFTEDAVAGGTNDTRIAVGAPVGSNFLVRFSHVDEETGRPVYLDKDGNQTFQWSPEDRVVVGSVLPKVIGGITNVFERHNWQLSFLLYFQLGGKIYDSSSKRQLGVVTDWNMRTDIYDRWRQPGDQATYPRLTRNTQTYGSGTPWINTDLWLHNGDYVRLRNISLARTFETFQVAGRDVSNFRIALTAVNWLTWTTFSGLEPEIARDFENATDRNMSPNITYLTPPQEKSIMITINANF